MSSGYQQLAVIPWDSSISDSTEGVYYILVLKNNAYSADSVNYDWQDFYGILSSGTLGLTVNGVLKTAHLSSSAKTSMYTAAAIGKISSSTRTYDGAYIRSFRATVNTASTSDNQWTFNVPWKSQATPITCSWYKLKL